MSNYPDTVEDLIIRIKHLEEARAQDAEYMSQLQEQNDVLAESVYDLKRILREAGLEE